jgi:UDPglucose--hexose-1-phosphate uridylyltransferase
LPELRIDPLTGLKTIVAGERASRPGGGFSAEPAPALDPESDPFLEGHEDRTPPEVYALRAPDSPPDTPGWAVRVVPNLYPALSAESEVGGRGSEDFDPLASEQRGEPEFFASQPAIGGHEVIVNSPKPVTSLLQLSPEEVGTAFGVWRERMNAHSDSAYVHVIVNEGRDAGASLPHTHSQLYALPFVPAQIARERERFTAYALRTHGRNLLGDLVQEEVRLRERIVAIDDEAVAICPYASRGPFEVQVVPRTPRASFEAEGALGAAMVHDVLGRFERVFGALPPLNLWVRTAPSGAEYFCWRIDVLPRLTKLAGLEMGTGVNLNVMPPEKAAEQLSAA